MRVCDRYLAIVSHPEVTAVVSNCQLDSAQEALYFGKPVSIQRACAAAERVQHCVTVCLKPRVRAL